MMSDGKPFPIDLHVSTAQIVLCLSDRLEAIAHSITICEIHMYTFMLPKPQVLSSDFSCRSSTSGYDRQGNYVAKREGSDFSIEKHHFINVCSANVTNVNYTPKRI